jgi:hypothetical protein
MTMSIRRLHHLPLLCVLLVSLLSSPVGSLGYVWCVGADGQATLEIAAAGDCSMDSPALRADDSPALTAGPDDCGPCHDISSTPRWSSVRTRNLDTPVSPPAGQAAVIATTDLSLSGQLLINLFPVEPPPRVSEPILQHRTIVLLI